MGYTEDYKRSYGAYKTLLIKKGTKYLKGTEGGEPMIAAESVLVCS